MQAGAYIGLVEGYKQGFAAVPVRPGCAFPGPPRARMPSRLASNIPRPRASNCGVVVWRHLRVGTCPCPIARSIFLIVRPATTMPGGAPNEHVQTTIATSFTAGTLLDRAALPG